MSAFMQGLQTGSQTARGWIDTYEAARKRREEADLKSRREGILTAQPEYSQGYTAEQGQQLEAMASAINPETGRPYYNVQAGQGGNYNVTPDFTEAQTPRMGMGADSQYGVAPVELQTTGLGRAGVVAQPIPFNQQRVANFLGGRVEGDLAPERMELMRSRALANTIADPMERQRALIQMDENERAARRGAQAEELTGLQINRERETVTREQKNREATQALSQQLSSGNPPDVTQIYKLASDFGVDPAPLVKLAADNMGLTEEIAKAATEKLVKQINAASTSPDKFRTLLDTVADPDPLDNIKPELRETKNGYRVFYGDRAISPEFKETKDMTALQQLAGFYRDTIAGKPYETAITMATLDAKRAAIEASRGQVRASDALTGLRSEQATSIRESAANAKARADLVDKFEALTAEEKAGAKGQGLIKQFNLLNVKAGGIVPLGARPSNRPEFTPKDYAATISSFVNAGLSPVDATIRADELYGRAPPSADVDAGLRQQDEAKRKGTPAAPIEVQPGERYMTTPGAAVRGPLNQFLRESRRGLFGGVEYFYTDPLTGKRYTTEQYNQLQNQ
jgi:hypothetical protein